MYGSLVVIKRDGEDGAAFPFIRKSVLLGRLAECDIRIALPEVSRHQCRLEVNEHSQVILTNLSSTNPTCVNGKIVPQSTPIYHNDHIKCHDRFFRFDYPSKSPYALLPKSPGANAFRRSLLSEIQATDVSEAEDYTEGPQTNVKTVVKRKVSQPNNENAFSTAKKRISFASRISPELFDKNLPASMPVKRGSLPPASPVPTKRKSLLRSASVIQRIPEGSTSSHRRSLSQPSRATENLSTPVRTKVTLSKTESSPSSAKKSPKSAEKASPSSSTIKSPRASSVDNSGNSGVKLVLKQANITNAATPPPKSASPGRKSNSPKVQTPGKANTSMVTNPRTPMDADSSLDSVHDFLTPEMDNIENVSPRNQKQSTKKEVNQSLHEHELVGQLPKLISPASKKVIAVRSSVTPAVVTDLRKALLKKALDKKPTEPAMTKTAELRKSLTAKKTSTPGRKSITVRKSSMMGKVRDRTVPTPKVKTWADIAKKNLGVKTKTKSPAIVTKLAKGKLTFSKRTKTKMPKFVKVAKEIALPQAGGSYVYDFESRSGHALSPPTIVVKKDAPTTSNLAKSPRKSNIPKPVKNAPQVIPSKTPDLTGVKQLVKSPKQSSKTPDLPAVRRIFQKEAGSKSAQLVGVKELMNSGSKKPTKTPDLPAVKRMFQQPAPTKSPKLNGVKDLLKSPAPTKSPRLSGVREVFRSEKKTKTPDLKNLKHVFAESKDHNVTLSGVEELFKSPASASKKPKRKSATPNLGSPKAKEAKTLETVEKLATPKSSDKPKRKSATPGETVKVIEKQVTPKSAEKVKRKSSTPILESPKAKQTKVEEKAATPKSTPAAVSPKKTRGRKKHVEIVESVTSDETQPKEVAPKTPAPKGRTRTKRGEKIETPEQPVAKEETPKKAAKTPSRAKKAATPAAKTPEKKASPPKTGRKTRGKKVPEPSPVKKDSPVKNARSRRGAKAKEEVSEEVDLVMPVAQVKEPPKSVAKRGRGRALVKEPEVVKTPEAPAASPKATRATRRKPQQKSAKEEKPANEPTDASPVKPTRGRRGAAKETVDSESATDSSSVERKQVTPVKKGRAQSAKKTAPKAPNDTSNEESEPVKPTRGRRAQVEEDKVVVKEPATAKKRGRAAKGATEEEEEQQASPPKRGRRAAVSKKVEEKVENSESPKKTRRGPAKKDNQEAAKTPEVQEAEVKPKRGGRAKAGAEKVQETPVEETPVRSTRSRRK